LIVRWRSSFTTTRVSQLVSLSILLYSLSATNSSSADPADVFPKGPYVATQISERILYPSLFGVSAGLPVADVSGVLLSNGNIRAYVFAQNKGIVVADSSDGKTFTQVGNAFGGDKGQGMPRVVKLSDGKFRMYNMVGDGIACSTSTDGINFTVEKSLCIKASDFPSVPNGLTGAAIVKLSDGSFRAYFSDMVKAGTGPDPHLVFSAKSSDGLNWVADSGVRVGQGSSITRSAEHPAVIAHSDGSVTLFYYDNGARPIKEANGKWQMDSTGQGVWYATSSDNGLTFSGERRLDFPPSVKRGFGNDPDLFLDKSGKIIFWGGDFDPAIGGTIGAYELSVFVEPTPPTPTPTQTPTPPTPTPPTPTPTPTVSATPTPSQTPVVIAPLPTKPAAAKKITITCVKGKTIKKVTAVNPKCPAGYKKK